MESQNCLMILIFIILGGYVIILGGYVIILGAYIFIFGAYSIIFGAYSIIFGAYSIIFGAYSIIFGAYSIIFGAYSIIPLYSVLIHYIRCFYHSVLSSLFGSNFVWCFLHYIRFKLHCIRCLLHYIRCLLHYIRCFLRYDRHQSFNRSVYIKHELWTTDYGLRTTDLRTGYETRTQAALLLVSTKNCDLDLWPGPTPEVRDSRTSYHSAHAQN